MLDKLLKKLSGSKPVPEAEPDLEQAQIAFTALLVEAARIDQVYTAKEAALINKLVMKQFAISEDTARRLRQTAEKEQAEANDIYKFSSVVKDEFSKEEKLELLEGMWEIIISDDEIDEYEEMIVRRLIGLIYITDLESAQARQRAEARRREQS